MSLDDATAEEWNAVHYENSKKRAALKGDVVNAPSHYKDQGDIECIDYIQQQTGDGFRDYLYGNLIKYLHRHRYKGKPVEDLRKARWYLERLLQQEVAHGER